MSSALCAHDLLQTTNTDFNDIGGPPDLREDLRGDPALQSEPAIYDKKNLLGSGFSDSSDTRHRIAESRPDAYVYARCGKEDTDVGGPDVSAYERIYELIEPDSPDATTQTQLTRPGVHVSPHKPTSAFKASTGQNLRGPHKSLEAVPPTAFVSRVDITGARRAIKLCGVVNLVNWGPPIACMANCEVIAMQLGRAVDRDSPENCISQGIPNYLDGRAVNFNYAMYLLSDTWCWILSLYDLDGDAREDDITDGRRQEASGVSPRIVLLQCGVLNPLVCMPHFTLL
ncbi:hypothetical protein C8F04DRAFT_1305880 [Mycena alexandri]|uniref:Uncharacterized protein n=1 Tax=Mycena alexandri TaxID=1745969 RepID=A0AAD6T9R6_9AGAR|nr:hypothetical protein C8F04DRAFT_1305880 [Mycena alexandri]